MRILFDIVHPADVLFFLHPIRKLQLRGDEVRIVSRRKDVTIELLNAFGLEHSVLSSAATGLLGLASELVVRDLAMLRAVRQFRPNVMIGLGGIAISHARLFTRRPAISFYAADTAGLQTRITWPFITHLYVPTSYRGTTPKFRTSRFEGVKELSYFHPDNFQVEDELARLCGWAPGRDHFFVRTVSWRANHDVGKSGWSDAELLALAENLSARGKLFISSERPLPDQLSPYIYRGPKELVHHLVGKCRLYVGESATMAHEACLLGSAAIYDGADHPGTTCELQDHGLLSALHQEGLDKLLSTIDEWLEPERYSKFVEARRAYLDKAGNLADYVVEALDTHALR